MTSFVGPSTLFGPFPLKRTREGVAFAPFSTWGPQFRLDEVATERVLACLRWERRLAMALVVVGLVLLPRLPKVPGVLGILLGLCLLILIFRLTALRRMGAAPRAAERIAPADVVAAQAREVSDLRLRLLSGLAFAAILASAVIAYVGLVNDEPLTMALGAFIGVPSLCLLGRYVRVWRAKRRAVPAI